jgi:hypothetical protein
MSIELVAATAPPPFGPENFIFYFSQSVRGRAVRQCLMGRMCDRPPLAFGLSEKREERILSKKGSQNFLVGNLWHIIWSRTKKRSSFFFAAPFQVSKYATAETITSQRITLRTIVSV